MALTPVQEALKQAYIKARGYWVDWTEGILRFSPGFGGGIAVAQRDGAQCGAGGHVDDHPTRRPGGNRRLAEHRRARRTGQPLHANQVHPEQPAQRLQRLVGNLRAAAVDNAGIVDQHINPPVPGQHEADHRRRRCRVRHIGGNRGMLRAEAGGTGRCGGGIDIGDHHHIPAGGEAARTGPANARRAAGDQDDAHQRKLVEMPPSTDSTCPVM